MRSAFLAISKKPPKVGGFLLQFDKKVFDLNEFHVRIVAVFAYLVKDLNQGRKGKREGKAEGRQSF
jgi:hypothetical protein